MWCKKKPNPIVPVPLVKTELRAISATVNKYPNPANNLNGCNADQDHAFKTLYNYWPRFDLRGHKDFQSTTGRYKSDAANAISTLDPGATVIVMADSCFSGTITRGFSMELVKQAGITKNRFYKNPDLSIRHNVNKPFAKKDTALFPMKWITMSACGEAQYSADAFISGNYHGAYSWFAWSSLRPGMTYYEWQEAINKILPSRDFEQKPQIEGPDYLLSRKVFEGQSLLIQNSSHGSQVDDLNGDESDSYDEVICLVNDSGSAIGFISDDEINGILQKIPV